MSEEMKASEEEVSTAETTVDEAESNLDAELDQIYESAEQEAEPAEQQAQAQPAQQPAQPQVQVPHTWGKDSQQLFAQLPPDIQQQIIKRENEREAVVRDSFAARRFAQAMQPFGQLLQDLEPYFRGFSQADGTPLWGNAQAMANEIKSVLGIKMMLARDPEAALHVMQQWAYDNAGYQPGQEATDPNQLLLRARLQQLEQQESQRAQVAKAQQQQAEQRQAINTLAGHVSNLGNTQNSDGSLAYPHLHGEHAERVGYIMGRWMRANMPREGITPEFYKQAYETAVFSLPETRELEMTARENARVQQFRTKSAAARKAQGINPNSKRSPEAAVEQSLDDEMEAIWAKYS